MSLMGLDVGTTGCKAVVFDGSGKVLSTHYQEYPLYFPETDRCELDPDEVWEAVQQAISRTATEVKGADPVQAIGISTLGDSVTPLDGGGNPLDRTVIGAADRRAVQQTAWIGKNLGREVIFDRTGAPLNAYCTIPKIMWFRDHKPGLYKGTKKFVGWQELVHLRLGLPPAMDYSLAGRTMLVDVHTRDWAYELFNTCDIDADLFYPLAPSNQIVGQIDSSHAEPLGLHAGVSVVAGGLDQCCCAMGAGVLESGMVALSVGTLEAITAVYETLRLETPLLDGNYGCIFHIVDGFYLSLGYVTTSGAVLRWYRNTLGLPEVQKARQQNRDPYEIMIHSTPEGPSSVYVLPYFAGTGTPWLDVNQRGTIFGLSLDTDRAEIIKGILDGICYEVRLNLETLVEAGIQVKRLRAIGGGAKSDLWMQLKADITGVPVETTRVTEAGCLGAAFLAGQGIGVYRSPHEILNIATVDTVFEPRRAISKQYEESYQTYKELRSRVKGLVI